MESRRDFVRDAVLVAGGALATTGAAAQPTGKARYVDKLTDNTCSSRRACTTAGGVPASCFPCDERN